VIDARKERARRSDAEVIMQQLVLQSGLVLNQAKGERTGRRSRTSNGTNQMIRQRKSDIKQN
jgi:hypothetical protein